MKTGALVFSFLTVIGANAFATDFSIPMLQCNSISTISLATGRPSAELSRAEIVREACQTNGDVLRKVTMFRADVNKQNPSELFLLAQIRSADADLIYRVNFVSPAAAARSKALLESGKVAKIVLDPRIRGGHKGAMHDIASPLEIFKPEELILFVK